MLEPSRIPPHAPVSLPPSIANPDARRASAGATFGPADLGGGGGGLGGGFDPDDGPKKKRFSPGAVVVGMLILAGAGVVAFLATKTEQEKLSIEQMQSIKKGAYVLPRAEQMTKWRELASKSPEYELRSEALRQLAWADDKQGIEFAIAALADVDHRTRGDAAQVLAFYGSPAADAAKAPLLKALAEAQPGDKQQILWALVTLKEPQVFDQAMEAYRAGQLAQVERMGGGRAFDTEKLTALVPVDKIASLAGDASAAVRQLVATTLSRGADAKFTDVLIKLVKDPDIEVAREAATGLGKIADEKARGPLLDALAKADKDSRQKFLEALRDGIGGQGLGLALGSVSKEKQETNWHQTKQIFEMLQKLADPRVGDVLLPYIKSDVHMHWKTEAALRMAEVGDLRAVPILGERMKQDPLKLYSDANDYERNEKKTDKARVVSARMLADLAVLHPEAAADLRAKSEDGLIHWVHEYPSPHANGLRALVAQGSTKDMPALRAWADPKVALPKEGQQPPMPDEWVIAQTALRYVGWAKDETSWGVLEKQLKRRDPKIDVTMDALNGAGLAILGMTLRGLGVGASQGFAQWGDPKAYPLLVKFIEEDKENEQARQAACESLAWVATEANMDEVAKKVHQFSDRDPKKQFIRGCYAETLVRRPVAGTSAGLVDMLTKDTDMRVRHDLARAIGLGGFDERVQARLFEKLADPEVRTDAALALVLGGGPDVAARTVAMFGDYPKEQLDELKDIYYDTFGYWSDDDLKQGRLYKWVETAEAIARIRVRDTAQDWARLRLGGQFDNLEFDNGPHSMTRVVLRVKLIDEAKKGDPAHKKGAIQTLRFMKEQGALMALRNEPGDTGALAKQAFFELMNPKPAGTEVVPTKESAAEKK